MVDGLPPEVAHVEAEHLAAPERLVAPRGGIDVAGVVELDPPDRGQAAPEVGVLAVELDRGVEAADRLERRAPQRELPP